MDALDKSHAFMQMIAFIQSIMIREVSSSDQKTEGNHSMEA